MINYLEKEKVYQTLCFYKSLTKNKALYFKAS